MAPVRELLITYDALNVLDEHPYDGCPLTIQKVFERRNVLRLLQEVRVLWEPTILH